MDAFAESDFNLWVAAPGGLYWFVRIQLTLREPRFKEYFKITNIKNNQIEMKQEKRTLKIRELEAESVLERFATYQIEDNYSPYKVIKAFWKKYNLFETQEPQYWLMDLPRLTRPEEDGVANENELYTKFNEDVRDLLKAIYFQNRYCKDYWKSTFVK